MNLDEIKAFCGVNDITEELDTDGYCRTLILHKGNRQLTIHATIHNYEFPFLRCSIKSTDDDTVIEYLVKQYGIHAVESMIRDARRRIKQKKEQTNNTL